MIVVEGMDNSGKTTLGETLSERFNYPLVHSPGYCPEMLPWAKDSLLSKKLKIYDRHPCISERVYGAVLRGKDEFKSLWGEQIKRLFIDKKPLIIYCKPPNSVIVRDLSKQMEGVEENSLKLICAYNRVMHELRLQGLLVIVYDFTEQSEIGWENLISIISYKERGFTW
jgi:hypothetical protein